MSGSVCEGNKREVASDPWGQFSAWYEDRLRSAANPPEAMTLVTATKEGKPSARMVLLKEFDAKGFVFYGNYLSRKGRDLSENPKAALLFYWPETVRQVRVEGLVTKIPFEASVKYFRSRPFEYQISALASEQSEPIASRKSLEDRFAAIQSKFEGKTVPMPMFWGGYRLKPEAFEFWQGRDYRLHDRLLYTKDKDSWRTQFLSP
jgi:pyridoxamine 5'-phosphate oxidase